MIKDRGRKNQDLDAAVRSASLTTAIHLPRETWNLLRAVAFKRAQKSGGRTSVSGLIVSLVEEAREQLEAEIEETDDSSIDSDRRDI